MNELDTVKQALDEYETYRKEPTDLYKEARHLKVIGDGASIPRLEELRTLIANWPNLRAQALAKLHALHDAPARSITKEVCQMVLTRRAQGFSIAQISWMFGISEATTWKICKGQYTLSTSANPNIGSRGHRKPRLNRL